MQSVMCVSCFRSILSLFFAFSTFFFIDSCSQCYGLRQIASQLNNPNVNTAQLCDTFLNVVVKFVSFFFGLFTFVCSLIFLCGHKQSRLYFFLNFSHALVKAVDTNFLSFSLFSFFFEKGDHFNKYMNIILVRIYYKLNI